MNYPNFRGKHLKKALFTPLDFPDFKKNSVGMPKKFLIVYYDSGINYLKRKFRGKYQKRKVVAGEVLIMKNFGVVKMKGIGAPHAVTVMEELIALGVKDFINIGSSGGLDDFGIFLCDKAIRDEGTSHHYHKPEKYAYPDKRLKEKLGECMRKKGMNFEEGTSWTIDAPYMETKSEIECYKREGVKTVEMEASALFTVCKVRKARIASAFVVSDVLGKEKWDPQFNARQVRQKMNMLIDAAIECLKSLK